MFPLSLASHLLVLKRQLGPLTEWLRGKTGEDVDLLKCYLETKSIVCCWVSSLSGLQRNIAYL